MAIYYKGNKVSPIKHETSYIEVPSGQEPPASIDSSTTVTVTRDLWEDLETAVKNRTGTYNTATFSARDMIQELNGDYNVHINKDICFDELPSWTRPQGWPNLDSLNLTFSGANDFIYMTYKTGHVDDFFACYIKTVSGTATIDFGHISNGTYVVDSTRTAGSTSGTTQYYYFNSAAGYNEGYTVIRVSGKLSWFLLTDAASANGTPDGRTFKALQQHLLERIAYVPNLVKFYDSYRYWGTYNLQRERIGNNTGTACTSLYDMYYWCINLRDLDISEFFTPNNTSLYQTFYECERLQTLDMTHWNTSKVTTLYGMCYQCLRLQLLDLSTWNTSALAGAALYTTFYDCRSLTNIIGLGNFQTANVTSVGSLFTGCRSLNNLSDVSNWNITKITNMASTFSNCYKLKEIDLSTWDVSKVTDVNSLFNGCFSLRNIKFPTMSTSNITNAYSMFNGCYSLQNVDVSWLKMDAGTCTRIGYMFQNCRTLKEINIPSNWNLSGLNNKDYSAISIFSSCMSVEKITGITNWDLRGTVNLTTSSIFYACYSLKELDISGWKIKGLTYASMFNSCYSLESIDISGFDSSVCTAFNSMFTSCYNLKEITFPEVLDISLITTMDSMFGSCYALQSLTFLDPADTTTITRINTIKFSSFTFPKVTTLNNMFVSCSSLKEISINNWSLPACTTIANMFRYCYSLEKVSWTGWSVPKITSTAPSTILGDCWSLKQITGLPPVPLAFTISVGYNLELDQIIGILNNLPDLTGKTSRALTLNNININRLSAAEKAIATNKNWTLAN